ncbi:type VII secretion protein EccB [Allorhizocola rhizosphaerae]|uniref:type VII secretion protein EccB n=1 Tax=Allorhizocola rhizosphaerae TaxID=1872709 RepID=UPI000E3ED78F|nr:type VII secretion protein EccB [Allorhizocola rhizosphaerae]
MPSRQEQLQSYQFMVQRVVSALVLRETDPPQSPFRRAVGAAFVSVLVTVIIAAGFGVYSIFTGGGNQQWRKPGAVIIEKDTSAVFVFREGKLHPALNFTSAMLASEAAKPPVFRVAAKSLQDVPWGQTIGIRDVPNTLAGKKNLAGYPWSVCTTPTKDGPVSTVLVGETTGTLVGDGEAFLVKSSTRGAETYLLWKGRLFPISANNASLLGKGAQPTVVSPAFVNGLPEGRALQPVNPGPNAGKPSQFNPQLWVIGEIIVVQDVAAEDRYVIVLEDRIAWISQVQAQLSGRAPRREAYGDVTNNGKRQIVNDMLPQDSGAQTPPADMPSIVTYNGPGLCSVIKDDKATAELRKDVTINLDQRPKTARRSGDNAIYADYVLVPNGKGAVVLSGQTYIYVSRDGVRYAMASAAVKDKLGFDGVTPLNLPSQLVALLPEGPGLDPTEAMVPVTIS